MRYLKYYPGADAVRTWADFNDVRNSTEGGPGQCALRFHLDLGEDAPAKSLPIGSVELTASRTSPCQTKWIAMNPGLALQSIIFLKTLFPPVTPLANVWPCYLRAQQKLAAQGINIDLTQIGPTVEAKMAELNREMIGFIVIHELGH